MMKNGIMKEHVTFEIGTENLLQSPLLQTLSLSFFCQTPDNFQSETELSYWTMQRDWIKKAWIEKYRTY